MSNADTITDPRLKVGANKPPSVDTVKEGIAVRHKPLFDRMAELVTRLKEFPEKISDDATAGQVGDVLKAVRAWLAQMNATRKIENEEWRRVVAQVNATFNIPIESLEKLRDEVMARNEAYLEEKLAREKAVLEERARKEREESERREAEAREAEQRRLAAEAAAREAEQREAAARAEKERAEREAKESQERARRALEEEMAADARRKEADAKERADATLLMGDMTRHLKEADVLAAQDCVKPLSAEQDERLIDLIGRGGLIELAAVRVKRSEALLDGELLEARSVLLRRCRELADEHHARTQGRENERAAARRTARMAEAEKERAEADARAAARQRDIDAANKASAEREEAEAAALAAKQRAKDAREEEKDARADLKDAKADIRVAGREERAASGAAERHESRAEKHERKAEGPEGDLIRTRGDLGSVGTLARRWNYYVIDRQALAKDGLKIWAFIHQDAIDTAIQKYMDGGGRDLAGVEFKHETEGRVI